MAGKMDEAYGRPRIFGEEEFPNRSNEVTAKASARGVDTDVALAGTMATVCQTPDFRAWTATLETPCGGDQRTVDLLPEAEALASVCAGTDLLSQGMGGTAAGWV